jgi:glycosyltransferase involved in cell wall biosynthesis
MIDIIIPVKGRSSKLSRALKSLVNQTYKEFEVTVVNDHSSPEERTEIARICSEYKGAINLIDSKGTGAPAARNFGFEKTSHPYVLWFDSDDLLLPNKLEHDLQFFESNTFDFIVSRAQHLEKGQLIDQYWGASPHANKGAFQFPFQTMCALISRAFLVTEEIKWNEDNLSNDDWEFSNECYIKSSRNAFSNVITSHDNVPNATSGSIGSSLNRIKIESQFMAIENIAKLQNKFGFTPGLYSRMRTSRHRQFLLYACLKNRYYLYFLKSWKRLF